MTNTLRDKSVAPCPDGGRCHHNCDAACWCVFPNNEWPRSVAEAAAILRLIDEHIAFYPEDVFPPSGDSRDAIAADAIRWKLRQLAKEIREGKHLKASE